jgi:hypothetical protein
LKRIAAIALLVALAAGVWFAARWQAGRDDLDVTIIFRSAEPLQEGNDVVEESLVIGRVTAVGRLDRQDAVSVTVDGEHRKRILSDTAFSIEGEAPDARLVVTNRFSSGPPVADGAVLHAREERLGRWLEDRGREVAPAVRALGERASRLIAEYEEGKFDERLEEWRRRYPEWQKSGREVVDRNVESLQAQVRKGEELLRSRGRDAEARRLREKFDEWLREVRRKENPPADPTREAPSE